MMTDSPLDLEKLTEEAVQECGQALRKLAHGAPSRRLAAERMVAYLYENARDAQNERSCVLVRCFQTASYAQLPLDYQEAADKLLDLMPSQPDMRCLSLLATRGVKRTWNDVTTSLGHQAIPLPSAEVVRRAPMIARLLSEMGMTPEQAVAVPDSPEFLVSETPRALNVFHIPDALGSPFIPAQEEFVKQFGVRSVIGMGGLLPEGGLFAIILFTRAAISRKSAALLQSVAADASEALAPFSVMRVFTSLGKL